MEQEHQRIRQLIAQYLEGNLSDVDEAEFWGYVEDPSFEAVIKQILSEKLENETNPTALDKYTQIRILNQIYNDGKPSVRLKKWRWLPYAAAVLITAMGVGLFLYDRLSQPADHEVVQGPSEDIQPGGNRAILTLADGREILLNEGQSGIVLSDEEIKYKDGDPLASLNAHDQSDGSIPWLELKTPKGGTYQVTLPDGTDVWLNAGSALRYPARFDREQRTVELSGEAYFEVAQVRVKSRKVPFFVKTTEQTVEVLGTQFNLSAYADDADVKTTLVEGSVRIASATDQYRPILLKPGQQSVQKAGTLAVAEVDVRPFFAWKEGYFHFKSTPFSDVVKQMTRWYDIDVVFKGSVPTQTFSGKMSRDVSLQNVLKFFEGSGVKFTVKDGKLIVDG